MIEHGVTRRTTRRAGVLLAIAALLAAAGCAEATGPQVKTLLELHRHRQRWNSQRIDHYAFDYRRYCFCFLEAARLEVSDGTIVAATLLEPLEPWRPPNAPAFYATIDELFDVVDHALRSGADVVEVSYDETLGYPTTIWIDYYEDAADDEIGYSASNLVVVPD